MHSDIKHVRRMLYSLYAHVYSRTIHMFNKANPNPYPSATKVWRRPCGRYLVPPLPLSLIHI